MTKSLRWIAAAALVLATGDALHQSTHPFAPTPIEVEARAITSFKPGDEKQRRFGELEFIDCESLRVK